MRDLHIHTEHSCDSEADIELYVKKAIEFNIETICFTDHVDLNKNDFGYDAHVVENLGADYLVAKSLVDKVSLQEVIYKKRKRIMV